MVELIIGSMLTLISLLIGFSLGKNQTIITQDTKKQISQIFKRVVPNPEVGPVQRPDALTNYYRDNPQAAQEASEMNRTLETLNK